MELPNFLIKILEFFPLLRNQPLGSDFQRRWFFAEDSRLTMKNVVLAAKTAAVLFLLFSPLDYLLYPQFFWVFLILRIVCGMVVLFIAHLSQQHWARRRYRIFATLVPVVTAFFLSLMILIIQDPATVYYAGLNLCIVGTGTLFQWTSREATITSVLVFGMFFMATLPSIDRISTTEQGSAYVGSCLFIVSTAILVIIGALTHRNFRYNEFVSRSKLRKNRFVLEDRNQKLRETLSALRETEKQLYQSEKMSFLGEMSAGVIHEIGNPLNFTNQALYILRKRLENEPLNTESALEVVNDMQEGLDRMQGIIADLQEFSHYGKKVGEPYQLNESIETAFRILAKPIEESGVRIEKQVESGLEVVAVKNQITQVVSNLIHNAIHAMAEKESGVLRVSVSKNGDSFADIEISDNGSGIAESDIKKLFNPFFTTKDPGKGTGLGLSICYRIIEAHGGTIKVKSRLGEGTTFNVLIPIRV